MNSANAISTETVEGKSFKIEAVGGFGGVTRRRGRKGKIVQLCPFANDKSQIMNVILPNQSITGYLEYANEVHIFNLSCF